MNVLKETESKLKYWIQELEDFETIFRERPGEFSINEKEYFYSRIKKIKHNIEYFTKILEVLNGGNYE